MKNNYLFISSCSLILAIFSYYSYNNSEKNAPTHSHYCAVQATPDIRTFVQANGISFNGFIKGNRAVHYIETKDGYTVLKDKNGFYKYAVGTSDGDLAITDMIVHEVGQRTATEKALLNSIGKNLRYTGSTLNARITDSPAATAGSPDLVFPSTGIRKALLLLVDFPDQLATYTTNDFDNLANQAGYNVNGQTGSFRDYYQDISYGALTINTDVQGWYTAPNNKATYGDDAAGAVATDLVRFAVDEAETAGLDFAQYDGDGDGKVDVVMVIHSGRGAEESGNGDDIWSHRWVLAAGGNSVTYDGVLVNDYIIQGEKYGSVNITNIGVLCHEFGHALGLPDLYDTDYSSSGIGSWGLMAGGTWNNSGRTPAQMSAWSKVQMGWMNPTVLTNDSTVITDMDYSDNSNACYRLNTPAFNEYFLVENRQKQGWDAYLPSEGLAIWHINDNKFNNADDANRLVNLEAADGSDNGSLFPGTTNNTAFNDLSTPNAHTYDDAYSGFCLFDIAENGDLVSFQFATSCFPASCSDGIKNGDETAIDCGGSCPQCICQNTTIAAPSITTGVTMGNGNNCDLRESEDITYEFTVPTDGAWTITTCDMADFDTDLLLGTTCCSNDIGENDDSVECPNGSSSLTAELTANINYYVTIEGVGTEMSSGNFDLEIMPPACMSDATMTAPFNSTGTTIGMGNNCDPDIASPTYGNAEDVIYEIEIPHDGTWEFSLENSDYDTYLFLGTSCCSMDIAVDDDNGQGLTSKINQQLTAGIYYVAIDGWSGRTGNYGLDVYEINCNSSTVTTFTGDYCAGDTYSLTVGSNVFNETNPSGSVTLINSSGCDSVVTVNLTFYNNPMHTELVVICENDAPYTMPDGSTESSSGTYGPFTLISAYNCDSLVIVDLTINTNVTHNEQIWICENDAPYTMPDGSTESS
ncbi:MAG: M6 family metalloprotease domain-containing protein, partial [Chitinophagales bacterium]